MNKLKMPLKKIITILPLIAIAAPSVVFASNHIKREIFDNVRSSVEAMHKAFNKSRTATTYNTKVAQDIKIISQDSAQSSQNVAQQSQNAEKLSQNFGTEQQQAATANFVHKEKVPFTERELAKIAFAKNLKLLSQDEIKAASGFQEIVEKFPRFHAARFELIKIYHKVGWDTEAMELIKDGLKISKDNANYLLKKAQILVEKKQLDKSLGVLLHIKGQKKETAKSKALLAYVYLQMGQSDLAGRNYSELVKMDDANSKFWLGLALSFESMGDNKNAINSFIKVKRLGGVNSEVLKFINSKLESLQSKTMEKKTTRKY